MLEQIDIRSYVLSLKKRWPFCLTVFVSVILLGLIITVGTQKRYKSFATIKVNLDAPNAKLWAEATNYQKITSTPQISVEPARDLKSVMIVGIDKDPKNAADLVNQAVSLYLKYQTEKKEEAVQREEKNLRLQQQEAKEKLSTSQKVFDDYNLKNKLLNQPRLESQIDRVRHRIGLFEEQLVKVQAAGKNQSSKEQFLKETILKEQEQETRLNQLISETNFLKSDIESNLKKYNSYAEQISEMKLKNSSGTESIFSIEPAQSSTSPYQPNWKKNLILSVLFALLLSIGIALILEMLDKRTFKTGEQIEELLKLPFLGFSDSPDLRRNLLLMDPDKRLKSITITSVEEKEDKTKTSFNLASACAESGLRVLLVDCNFKRFLKTPGLSNILIGESQLDYVLASSSVANLDLLGSGQIPPMGSSLFQSAKFSELFEELKKRYDTVVFDSSLRTFGVQVDATVLEIKAGKTLRELVEKSVKILIESHANLLGVVLQETHFFKIGRDSRQNQPCGQYENRATA